ncbi:hypothetical protein BDV26DRAFT_142593 [Aspergillus bertholletiae]|uniref:Uncharacterized protein n=1 Tax=Aspergillus bertholletiae TaxID=1226010 RepID=A0A5N7BER2_9EURO|nr:hypothetical protein BDV26DRAFT_142593 [Aspergillus bertholletiae]
MDPMALILFRSVALPGLSWTTSKRPFHEPSPTYRTGSDILFLLASSFRLGSSAEPSWEPWTPKERRREKSVLAKVCDDVVRN